MKPDRVLVVDMGGLARGFPIDTGRYPGAVVAPYEAGALPHRAVQAWLRGLDVAFAVETLYDWRIPQWASAIGCATVVQANAEFFRPPDELPSVPTRWWAPTPWRMEHLPPDTRVVPVPVADDRFPFAIPEPTDALRVLHVAGHAAMADRNGTTLFLEALRRVHGPVQVRIITQDERLRPGRARCSVPVEVVVGGVENYWDLYRDADVLVLPRRYGGLCLPAQEAMASGLALIMSDAEPQRSIWPAECVRSATGMPRLACPGGRLALTNARPEAIADAINRLAVDRERLVEMQRASLAWAEAHRWSALRGLYERELEEVAQAGRTVVR